MLVSIVVPVFNCELYVKQCLESLINQTYSDIEIIVVDDGSTDSSRSIIEKYLNDPRVKLLTKKNSGPSDARNLGIEHSSGDYIGFMDADDWALPEMYEKMVRRATDTNADIVACQFYRVSSEGVILSTFKFRQKKRQEFGSNIIQCPELIFVTGSYAPNKIFRARLFKELEIRFPSGQFFEDSYIMPCLFFAANKIDAVKSPLFFYRADRSGSTSYSFQVEKYYDVFKSTDMIRKQFAQLNLDAPRNARALTVLAVNTIFWRQKLCLFHKNRQEARAFTDASFQYYNDYLPNWKPILFKFYAKKYSGINTNWVLFARTSRLFCYLCIYTPLSKLILKYGGAK